MIMISLYESFCSAGPPLEEYLIQNNSYEQNVECAKVLFALYQSKDGVNGVLIVQ